MKTIAVLLCLVSTAISRPQENERNAEAIEKIFELRDDHSYDASLETSNGILIEESGISYPGPEPETGKYVKSGVYSFTHPDGTIHEISYIADENGYQPEGDLLPTFSGRVDIQDV